MLFFKGMKHSFSSLADTAKQLQAELASLLRECSQELTEMCKHEKRTWQELDETEEACETLVERVNAKAEELVRILFNIFLIVQCILLISTLVEFQINDTSPPWLVLYRIVNDHL